MGAFHFECRYSFAVFLTDDISISENDRSSKYDNDSESDSDKFFKRIIGIRRIPSGPMLNVDLRLARIFCYVNVGNMLMFSLLLVIEANCGA